MWYFTGITISLFLCLLLILKKNKSSPDKILTCWIVLIALHQLLFYLEHAGILLQYPHLLGITFPLPLLHGVFLFFYVSAITQEKAINLRTSLPHFIPFLLLILLAIPFYSLSAEEKLKVFENEGEGFEWYSLLQLILIVSLGLGYVIWSLILIHKHRSHVQQLYSNTDKKNLKWMEYLSIGLGIIWLLAVFFDDGIIFLGVVALVLFIGFFGINQLPIFYASTELEKTSNENNAYPAFPEDQASSTPANPVRYAKSGLKEEEANRVYSQLSLLMKQEELYKKNDVTLTELAEELHIHPNYLSQVINEKEQKNFYHYINTLRVQEFIRIASQPESRKYTLLSLAYDCGFNSKSTFNKYFKNHTGKTPSEYFTS
jgi:AraC-like DNA-binding protein